MGNIERVGIMSTLYKAVAAGIEIATANRDNVVNVAFGYSTRLLLILTDLSDLRVLRARDGNLRLAALDCGFLLMLIIG